MLSQSIHRSDGRTENIRRMFHRWLAAARASQHRRVTLQQKEEEMKQTAITTAWDRWRDCFKDEKLRPIVRLSVSMSGLTLILTFIQEYDVILQSQRNLLFRSFGLWHSKTKVRVPGLPIIVFNL